MQIITLENGQKMQENFIGETRVLTPYTDMNAIVSEPIDKEKVQMAEIIIDLSNKIDELQNKLNGGAV